MPLVSVVMVSQVFEYVLFVFAGVYSVAGAPGVSIVLLPWCSWCL